MDEKQFAEITRAMGREITRRGALARLAAGLVAASGVSRLGIGIASATTITPKQYGQGTCDPKKPPITDLPNQEGLACACLGYGHGLKDDTKVDGGAGGITWDYSDDKKLVDWKSDFPIGAVIVKAGTNFNLVFEYDGGAKSDTGLYAPEDKTISHVIYCWNDALKVTKDATTSYDRDWDWTIRKRADQTDLILSEGQSFPVNYTVTVNATSADENFKVSGEITIKNPATNASAATIESVRDIIAAGGVGTEATVKCGPDPDSPIAFPYDLAPDSTLTCTYKATLPSKTNGVNSARVRTSGKVPGDSGQANVTFGDPTRVTDRCVDVTDTLGGTLGTVCGPDAPRTFNYIHTVGPYNQCGPRTVENTASLATDDGQTRTANWTVNVSVPCGGGCTLTQGYWKTHSQQGPAPYDDAWKKLGADEEKTIFFKSKQTYLQVLRTPPAGNPYYTLAHQYIAATLNILNGASAPASVQDALDKAKALFQAYTPQDVADNKDNTQSKFKKLVGILDGYNNGTIGPGHCSEPKEDAKASAAQTRKKGGNKRKNGHRKANRRKKTSR
jgi:hypothetical protein